MLNIILPFLPALILAAGVGLFAFKRGLVYLHIFQQEEYDGPRFVGWIQKNRAFDTRASALLIIAEAGRMALAVMLPPLADAWVLPITCIYAAALSVSFMMIGRMHTDPRFVGKKKLVMTARAQRIFMVASGLLAVLVVMLVANHAPFWLWVLAAQAIPFMLVLGNLCLQPLETVTQKRLLAEAQTKLRTLKPTVIGVSGAFGKTSTKHILTHILSSLAPTLMTPGSINTPMGITRVIREQLGPHHRYFLSEMGAYHKGSIARICDLVDPDMGILVSLGNAHLERFGSLDAIAETEGELPAYVAAKGGISIIGPTALDFAYPTQLVAQHRPLMRVVGTDATADLAITSQTQTAQGLVVEITWQGQAYTLRAPLFGAHHATNMALAFAAAASLDMPPALILQALTTTPQTRHRLEVLPQAGGTTLIDDAYNSNPQGFKAALDILSLLGVENQGRRILITPGMVELGAEHDMLHADVGAYAARHVDVFLPVVPTRIHSMVDAFKAHAPNTPVIPCATFADAQAWLAANTRAGDVILLENDLPDLYEQKLSF